MIERMGGFETETVQEQRERIAAAERLRSYVLRGTKIFREQVIKVVDAQESSSSRPGDVSIDFKVEEFESVFNQYVEACIYLPNVESIPRLPQEELDCALGILRLAAICRSLKRVKREEREEGNCAICQDELADCWGDARAIACGHKYHWRCIVQWLNQKNFCPLCRRKVPQLRNFI